MWKPETLLLLLLICIPSDLPSMLFHAGTIALLARRIWAAPIDPRVLGVVDQRFCPPASQPRSSWSSGLRPAQDDLVVIHLFTTLGVWGWRRAENDLVVGPRMACRRACDVPVVGRLYVSVSVVCMSC